MIAAVLALQLAAASGGPAPLALTAPPPLEPRLDPGPFRSGELALASVGTLAGDALVLGGGYYALTLFANGTLQPTAANFRTTAYVLLASAVLVPPLTAVVLARLGARGPLAGAFWKAMLLAATGEVAALATGYLAAPHFWLILPVQLVTLSLGASFGLHWGSYRAPAEATAAPRVKAEPVDPAQAPSAAALLAPLCPDA